MKENHHRTTARWIFWLVAATALAVPTSASAEDILCLYDSPDGKEYLGILVLDASPTKESVSAGLGTADDPDGVRWDYGECIPLLLCLLDLEIEGECTDD